jgi:hypothetical protein
VYIAAAGEERGIAAFHEAAHRREPDRAQRRRLQVLVVRMRAKENGIAPRRRRPVDVAVEERPVGHADLDVALDEHFMVARRCRPAAAEHGNPRLEKLRGMLMRILDL